MALTKEYITFFKELSSNNNTAWFAQNKKRYEQHVKTPFAALVGEVIAEMKKADPGLQAEPKDCIFRINKDIRFSADKEPYKNYMAAIVSRGGRKDHSTPGIYFHIEANRVSIAGGCYSPEKEVLAKIREAIAADPKRINKILSGKKFVEVCGGLKGDKYKVLPAAYKEAAEKSPAMYNKSFHFEVEHKGDKNILRKDLASFIVDHYKAASELNAFLNEAMGR